jgi:hypothetical protein
MLRFYGRMTTTGLLAILSVDLGATQAPGHGPGSGRTGEPARARAGAPHRPIAGPDRGRGSAHVLASMMRFIGVWATRRKWRKPASSKMARSFASPAWAPRAAPTSCDSELGVQTHDEAT